MRQCNWKGIERWGILDLEHHIKRSKVWWCRSLETWSQNLQCSGSLLKASYGCSFYHILQMILFWERVKQKWCVENLWTRHWLGKLLKTKVQSDSKLWKAKNFYWRPRYVRKSNSVSIRQLRSGWYLPIYDFSQIDSLPSALQDSILQRLIY